MRASKSWTVGSDEGLFCSQRSAKVSEVVTFEQNEGREQVKWISLEEQSFRQREWHVERRWERAQ